MREIKIQKAAAYLSAMKHICRYSLLVAFGTTVLFTSACKKSKAQDPAPAPNPINANFSYKLDGTVVTPTAALASRVGTDLVISAGQAGTTQSLIIQIGGITAPTTITNPIFNYAITGGSAWMAATGFNGSTGSVRVTAYDAVNKKMSGTFTATMVPFPGTPAMGSKIITQGQFTDLVIQ